MNSKKDCLDSNGPAYIEDGDVYMFSSAEDADIAKSNIKKLSVTMDETCKADTPFQVKDSTGETLYIVTPEGGYKNIFVCSPKIKEGNIPYLPDRTKKMLKAGKTFYLLLIFYFS